MEKLSKRTKIILSIFAVVFIILIATQFIWPVRVSFDSESTRQSYFKATYLKSSYDRLKEQGDSGEELLSDYPFEFSDDEEYRTIFVYFNVKITIWDLSKILKSKSGICLKITAIL